MPKSKRSKVVSLTKTDKKTREWKEGFFAKIRESIDSYDYVYPLFNGKRRLLMCRCGYFRLRICGIRI